MIAIVETEVLNCPLKTVETSLLSRLSRLYCWSWQDSTQASSANHRGSRLQLHADMHILCLNFYCICIWFGIVFVQHFFVQPQRLGGISGRSPVMYLWSGHTATRPSKASVIDSHSSLFTYSPLSPAAATLCLSKRILARGPKMASYYNSHFKALPVCRKWNSPKIFLAIPLLGAEEECCIGVVVLLLQ